MNEAPIRRIAVLPGDSIGTEVMESGVKVLRAVESSLAATRFELTEFSVFAEVQAERIYVDAAARYLVQRPEAFDFMVTENMFGDLLSDLTAGLVGGLGMAPSADIGEHYAVFQPAHGSAPDIAGKGIANPVATILSVAMMLDWFGAEDKRAGAEMIRSAVRTVFADPAARTRDMRSGLGTQQMTELITSALPACAQQAAVR